MISTTIPFNDSQSLTYTASEVDVLADKVQLKKLPLQDGEVFAATAKVGVDADRYLSSGTMTPVGTVGRVEVEGTYYYDLTYNATGCYYSIPFANVEDITNVYTIRMKIIPKYSVKPPYDNYIFTMNNDGSKGNRIELKHTSSGNLVLVLDVPSGNSAQTFQAPWSTTADQEYEIEIVNTGSQIYIFIDGVIFLSQSQGVIALARNSIRVGTNYLGNEKSAFYMRDLQIFSTALHTANFQSEVPRLVNVYSNSASVENVASVTTEELYSLSPQTFGSVKYAISISDVDYYISGGVLTPSNLSYTQANDIADIQSSLALINSSLGSGAFVKLIPILSSGVNGDEQSQIDSITYEYDFYSIVNPPSICTVYGFLYDNLTPILTASVRFFTKKPFKIGNVLTVLDETVAVDSSGYYEIDLAIPDASYPINFELSFTDADGKIWKDKGSIVVPNQQSAELNTIRV